MSFLVFFPISGIFFLFYFDSLCLSFRIQHTYHVLYEGLLNPGGDSDALLQFGSMMTPAVTYFCVLLTKYKSPEVIRDGVLFFIFNFLSLSF